MATSNGRHLQQVLGGSSSLNAMAYVRGHPLDMERWADTLKSDSWRYKNVLPYFKKSQTHSLSQHTDQVGDNQTHSQKLSTKTHFKQSQTHSLSQHTDQVGDKQTLQSRYRGSNGPLQVCRKQTPATQTLNQAFVQAGGGDAGYGFTSDQNGWCQEGFGQMDMTVDHQSGERASTMNCYLRRKKFPELRNRINIRTDVAVQRLLFADENADAPGNR